MPAQIEGEFPEILGIRESLIKHVFEPAALQVRPTSLPCVAFMLPPSCHPISRLMRCSVAQLSAYTPVHGAISGAAPSDTCTSVPSCQ